MVDAIGLLDALQCFQRLFLVGRLPVFGVNLIPTHVHTHLIILMTFRRAVLVGHRLKRFVATIAIGIAISITMMINTPAIIRFGIGNRLTEHQQ